MSNRLAPQPSYDERRETTPNQSSPALRVLVIEDTDDAAASLAHRLGWSGFEVWLARDAATAVRAAQAHPPDVVLLDLGLPCMNGFHVSQWLGGQRTARRPLLIAISGKGREGDRRRSEEAGMDLHLEKPVDFEAVRRLLHRFQAIIH